MPKKAARALKFDLPYGATPPALVREEVGLARCVHRLAAVPGAQVTIIDTADNRLLRAGVVLAHRISDGVGEWYLAAPDWLSEPLSEPLDAHGETPPEFARLVRPFARRSMLGPVAAIDTLTDEFALRAADDTLLAVLHDQRITVRRSGVTIGRYREITVLPHAGLNSAQRDFISEVMSGPSTAVQDFPSLQQRLGTPATGGTDFPQPQRSHTSDTVEDFVSAIFAADLGEFVRALLREESKDQQERLADAHAVVRDHSAVLASVLDSAWSQRIQQLTDVAGQPLPELVSRGIEVVDELVMAVRAPQVGDRGQEPAGEALHRMVEDEAFTLADTCRSLAPDAADELWQQAAVETEQLLRTTEVAETFFGKRGAKLRKRVRAIYSALRGTASSVDVPDLDTLSAVEAFELGRQAEVSRREVAQARAQFVDTWPDLLADLRKATTKLRKNA